MKRKEAQGSRHKRRAAERARRRRSGKPADSGRDHCQRLTTATVVAEALEDHKAGRLRQAEAGYRAALARAPKDPDANNLLGMLALDTGFAGDAISLFRKAIAACPGVAAYHLNLGNALMTAGRLDDATRALHDAIDLEQGIVAAPYNLGLLHLRRDEHEEALVAFRAALEVDPRHPMAKFLVTALSGEQSNTAPPAYVADLFDSYASQYDDHLQETLACTVPQGLLALVNAEETTRAAFAKVLDLGCGTGLCGRLFRERAGFLLGSDLSPLMIEKARARGIYDELRVEDLVNTLARASADADLVLAGDVFVYVGELGPVFAACAGALRRDGLFAFSAEECPGEGFRLQRSCRFAHSERYVRGLAAEHGFAVARADEGVLRTHRGQPVCGRFYLMRRE